MTPDSYEQEYINFREIHVGRIAPKWLYRSSHPAIFSKTDFILSKLAEEAGIATVLNLGDNKMELSIKASRIPWYHCLFEKGCIIALGMGFNCLSDQFSTKLQDGIKFILEHNGPYLIHCFQGIDRTGFVVMLLEMLMGADKDEMANDYMMSFLGRPGLENGSEAYKRERDDFIRTLDIIYIIGKTSLEDDLAKAAENYLSGTINLSLDEINLLKLTLSENKKRLPG
jgi:protein tyrosine/serine phosphatase